MANDRQHQDASSADTVFDQTNAEKPTVDAPSEEPTQAPVATQPDNDADSVEEKTSGGAPLDRTPSQAAKMGKKKIIAVMAALCVRNLRKGLLLGKARGEMQKNEVQKLIW
jgi:hypothetical protein